MAFDTALSLSWLVKAKASRFGILRRCFWLLIVLLVTQIASATFWLAPASQAEATVPMEAAAPLWSGSRFTETDRKRALERALSYIYRTSLNRSNFASYASDYLWCFYTLSFVVRDQSLKQEARRMGVERALAWRRLRRSLPRDADLYTVQDYLNPGDVADSLVVRDDELKDQIRRAAQRFSAREVLLFDPRTEPP